MNAIKWTKERLAKARALRRNGDTWDEAATRMGVSNASLRRALGALKRAAAPPQQAEKKPVVSEARLGVLLEILAAKTTTPSVRQSTYEEAQTAYRRLRLELRQARQQIDDLNDECVDLRNSHAALYRELQELKTKRSARRKAA